MYLSAESNRVESQFDVCRNNHRASPIFEFHEHVRSRSSISNGAKLSSERRVNHPLNVMYLFVSLYLGIIAKRSVSSIVIRFANIFKSKREGSRSIV